MNEKYDIVIVSHEKDFNKLKFVIGGINRNLNFDYIHLILSDREPFTEKDIIYDITPNVLYHKETDILTIDKSRLKYRPNWIYQMMLKFFQNVTKNDNYLVVEADCIINMKFEFFIGDKTIFYLGEDQNNKPYFDFNQKILNIGREYDHSFISEFMMYDKTKIKDLLNKAECEDSNDFIEKLILNIDESCYPADYELYGNFLYKYYKDKMLFKKLKYNVNYGWDKYSDDKIVNIISNSNEDIITLHTWLW